jgi:ribosomal protein L32
MFFFIVGVNTAAKELGTIPNTVCLSCGAYARLTVTVIYSVFSLFFIPLFKWNRRYIATASCCNAVFEIDADAGRDFERGRTDTIDSKRMHKTSEYTAPSDCPYCGAVLPPGAHFCYNCGRPML